MAYIYNNIAFIYAHIGSINKAVENTIKGLTILRKENKTN